MPAAWLLRPRIRLWMKLAAFAAIGVVCTQTSYMVLGGRIAERALAREQEGHGIDLARLVAQEATDAVLVDDQVLLQEIVGGAAASEHVAYCFIERDGRILASSFAGTTPPGLAGLRRGANPPRGALLVRSGAAHYLDVSEPILEGSVGFVRLGLDRGPLQAAAQELAVVLGVIAISAMLAGLVAAFVVGRRVARPVGELLAAADRFDPAAKSSPVAARGTDEFADLARRFNLMMARLQAAHDEKQRALQKSIATERLVALGSLVAGVAHEVNNPLAGLKNCRRRLERDDLPPLKRRQYSELMGESLARIEAVVRRLLDFGRPQPLRLHEVSPEDLARESCDFIRPLLRERKIELEERVGDSVRGLRVLADRRQVGQALLNLVLNAAFVTPEGGQIRLRLRRKAPLCGLSVEDDGPGIPLEIRDRILDPFFSTKPEGEGTGLGLTLTRTIVDAHGGDLTFEFPETGTVATIWLRETGN